ncbi:RNA-directed DNA polymerase, eukaryota, partial [Tanacetum coccineum]
MEDISSMEVKFIWGNSRFDYISSNAIGNSGGILCIWDPNTFLKDHHIISDNFVVIAGTWLPSNSKLLIISIYAPQSRSDKRILWGYISSLISRWQGDSLILGDFNEVRSETERRGSVFNVYGAADFNDFIAKAGLINIQLEGYSFPWSHPSACKMSKLDRFLVTEGFFSVFPHCSAICLDRHLSDHRPILLREVFVDYGATPFRFYHSWINISGFDLMISQVWKSFSFDDSNDMIRFKKKLQALKVSIRDWIKLHKKNQTEKSKELSLKLSSIDQQLDQGIINDDLLLSRMNFMKQLHDLKSADSCNIRQKAKIKREMRVMKTLSSSMALSTGNVLIWLSKVLWLMVIGLMIQIMLKANSALILLPDFKGQSKHVENLISEVQSAFLPKRQILDGPFVINEVLSWCKHKRRQAMIFKVDFAKTYDSVRWDFLDDVLLSFGFGQKWKDWILGSLSSGKASVLVNGSPTSEFQFHCGLKQGDPLAPYLFILVMESLHLSFARTIEAGLFKGLNINNSVNVSHLFYVDDAVFVGEWSDSNLSCIMNVLHCFFLTSGLKINIQKSHLLGVGVSHSTMVAASDSLGCSIMKLLFIYLGVPVGGNMASIKAWDVIIGKL